MRPAPACAVVLSALSLPGCTLIGLAVGAHADAGKRPQPVEPARLATVEKGQRLDLTLADGQVLHGKLLGLAPLPSDEYARRWAWAREQLGPGVPLPPLGAPVFGLDGSDLGRAFEGVDPGAVLASRPGQPGLLRLDLAAVGGVGQAPERLDRAALLRLVHEGRLPARSQVVLSGPGQETRRIGAEYVAQASVVPAKNGKLTGALVGLAVDALVVGLAVTSLNEPWDFSDSTYCPPGEPCVSSCPLVYSFDGRAWQLDSEVFGAAVFERAQRTDRAVLEHLAESDGRYRLRLRDEMDEIQWLDAARLVVVDHPPGTRVVPGLDGRLHLLGPAASAPPEVRDLRGRDLGALLAARDGRAWTSDALAVAPELRDGLELRLPRPAGARSVTLAVRARSTPWADLGKARLMALLGDGVEAWRARLERDDAARAEFLGALRREGLLTLRAWDGTRWREVTALPNFATAVEREQAVRVDLAGLPAQSLRFRLDATPGLWTIDALTAEFDAAVAGEVRVLAPLVARAADGRDLRELLAAEDGRRFEMEPWRGEAHLEFAAPPPQAGRQRTLALEATGHYVTLSRASGPGQPERFDQLVREPGAFARFSLELQRQAAAGEAGSARASAGAR